MPGYYTSPPSGGSGFDVGAEVDVTAGAVASTEITPADPTKATLIWLNASADGSGNQVQLGSYNGNTGNNRFFAPNATETLMFIAAAGETYYFSLNGATLNHLTERTLV